MDYSIYEKANPTRQGLIDGFAFGRITRVFPNDRLCEVKTFFGTGPKDDNHIPKAQWINMDSNPNGDESGGCPRVNSYCMVFYVAGEPLVFGFFSPLTVAGTAAPGETREELTEGDRIMSTLAGNKIIVRSHGEIQIESTETCRTIYFPDEHLINTLCRNFEFRTDGGTIDWINFDEADNTIYSAEYRDNISRSNVIIVECGLVEGNIISRTEIGTGGNDGADNVVWTKTIKNTGETELFIRAPGQTKGHKYTIFPDGTTKLNVADKTNLTILPTGETTLDVGPSKATLNIKPSGDTTYTTKGKIAMTCDGALTAVVKGGLTATVTGAATVKASGTVDIECMKAIIKAQLNQFKGGAVSDNEINDDPITGIPLMGVGGIEFE